MIIIWNSDDMAQLYQGYGFAVFNWSGAAGADAETKATLEYSLEKRLYDYALDKRLYDYTLEKR